MVKVFKTQLEREYQRPTELRRLKSIPNCNRIVKLLGADMNKPNPDSTPYPLNSVPGVTLQVWYRENFGKQNNKQVPESYIWGDFIQHWLPPTKDAVQQGRRSTTRGR